MEFSLNPGHSLGPIELGSLLWNVLSILRAEQATFKHVQLCWEAGKPATGYLLLITTSPPARLLFEGVHQRLLLIEAHQSPSHDRPIASCPALGEWIHYQNQPLSLAVGPNEPGVTLRVIHRLFGPTYPPAPHTAHQNEMVVSYPGVAFSFSHEVLSRIILSVQPTGEDCKQDAGETVQLTEAYFKPKMPQYMGSIDGDLKSAKIKLGRIELEESTSINFSFHSSSSSREIPDVKVSIGRSTSEDILCDFGAPLRTFWKEDDRMRIHTHLRSNGRSVGQPEDRKFIFSAFALFLADQRRSSRLVGGKIANPYFMSYFNIGVDFLIDPINNAVLKIILHSNIPGEVLFARYSRCPWSLVSTDEASDVAVSTDKVNITLSNALPYAGSPTIILPFQAGHINQQIRASFAPKEPDPYKSDGLAGSGKPCDSFDSHAAQQSPSQKVSELSTDAFSNMIEPAMLLDRTADVIDDGLVLRRPTRLYGHPGIVLEVTQDDDVETVWLF
ncbi:hypothetical protein PSHT_00528 [Puccinia striiformis]|uniref:Uncharacterized protein n=1 Tax=Puccinia striiformis TaxID=27350 RepID=A0A2S4WMP0_9BASI|nr:hypothetical protein PSHT_00528 [Puccinia striiformis]